jgi:hypothetical protein
MSVAVLWLVALFRMELTLCGTQQTGDENGRDGCLRMDGPDQPGHDD